MRLLKPLLEICIGFVRDEILQIFVSRCLVGELRDAFFLFHSGLNLADLRDTKVFLKVCHEGHEEVARWLFGLGLTRADLEACEFLPLEYQPLTFLHSVHGFTDAPRDVFQLACADGHLSLAKWLLSLGWFDVRANDNCAFRWACCLGHEPLAKWLFAQGLDLEDVCANNGSHSAGPVPMDTWQLRVGYTDSVCNFTMCDKWITGLSVGRAPVARSKSHNGSTASGCLAAMFVLRVRMLCVRPTNSKTSHLLAGWLRKL